MLKLKKHYSKTEMTDMEDLEKIEDLFFKMCDMDYVIVALELDENIRKFLKIKML